MTKVFLSSYYAILTYIFFDNGQTFFISTPDAANLVMFARPFSTLLSLKLSCPVIFVLGILFSFLCIIKSSIVLRVTTSVLFLILLSIKFSYGKISHSEHIWMISSVMMCFVLPHQRLFSFRNTLVLRLMQITLLSFYFNAGLWKLRGLGFSNWSEAALEHVADAVAEGNGPGENIRFLLDQDQPWLITLGFALVILFQLSSVIPVLSMKYFKFWGGCALLFHMSTGVALGIWFSSTALAALLILVFFENILEWELLEYKCTDSYSKSS